MGDLFNSIDKEKMKSDGAEKKEDTTVNTNKLRKQLKSLKKESEKAPTLKAPINGRRKKRQEMALNYEINQKNMAKYIGQVKRSREEVQSDFTAPDKVLHGGKVNLQSIA